MIKAVVLKSAMAAVLLIAAPSWAVTIYCGKVPCPRLSSPTGLVTLSDGTTTFINPGDPPSVVGQITGGSISGSITFTPSPALESSVESGVLASTLSQVSLLYSVRVVSFEATTDPAELVPITISGKYHLEARVGAPFAAPPAATIRINITPRSGGGSFSPVAVEDRVSGDCVLLGCRKLSPLSFSGFLAPGAVLDFSLYAGAFTQSAASMARAFIDPVVSIDPSFSEASLYAVDVSPGVGNVAVVPEPSALDMILVGSTVLLVICRRHRRTSGEAVGDGRGVLHRTFRVGSLMAGPGIVEPFRPGG